MLQTIVDQLRKCGINVSRYNHNKRMATESIYAIQQLLGRRNVDVVFDIGANIGQTANCYRRLFPDAKIYSFEPSDPAFSTLASSFHGDAKFSAYKLAISNVDGTKEFFCSDDDTPTRYSHRHKT